MYVVKFCRAPSQLWCGVVEYNGGHIFSAGRTMDDLLKRMKGNVYTTTKGQVANRQIYLDTKQHDTYEFEKLYKVFMSNMFVAKFWKSKDDRQEQEPDTHPVRTYIKRKEEQETQAPKEIRLSKRDEFVTEQDGDTLVVYVLREVARYKLHNVKPKPVETHAPVFDLPKAVLNTSILDEPEKIHGPETPVLQCLTESQAENL